MGRTDWKSLFYKAATLTALAFPVMTGGAASVALADTPAPTESSALAKSDKNQIGIKDIELKYAESERGKLIYKAKWVDGSDILYKASYSYDSYNNIRVFIVGVTDGMEFSGTYTGTPLDFLHSNVDNIWAKTYYKGAIVKQDELRLALKNLGKDVEKRAKEGYPRKPIPDGCFERWREERGVAGHSRSNVQIRLQGPLVQQKQIRLGR